MLAFRAFSPDKAYTFIGGFGRSLAAECAMTFRLLSALSGIRPAGHRACVLLPENALTHSAIPPIPITSERWPSGRRRSPAKGVYRRRYRGFESLPLRHFLDLTPVCVAYPRSGGRRAGSQPRPAASTGALSAAFRHIFSLQPEVRGAVSAAPLCATARRAACRLSQLRHDVSPLACRPCPGEDRPSDAGWRSRGRPGA